MIKRIRSHPFIWNLVAYHKNVRDFQGIKREILPKIYQKIYLKIWKCGKERNMEGTWVEKYII